MKRLFLVGLFTVLAVVIVGVLRREAVPDSNYRILVTVDDEGRLRSGSGIWSHQFPSRRFYAEAVPIDLGRKGVLFALPTSRSVDGKNDSSLLHVLARRYYFEVAGLDGPAKSPEERSRDVAGIAGRGRVLHCGGRSADRLGCPVLVYFRDPRNPRTAIAIGANEIGAFIAGAKLRSISFKITNEPLRRGRIYEYLPWLKGNNDFEMIFERPGESLRLDITDFDSGAYYER